MLLVMPEIGQLSFDYPLWVGTPREIEAWMAKVEQFGDGLCQLVGAD